jgi:hypothetical protein
LLIATRLKEELLWKEVRKREQTSLSQGPIRERKGELQPRKGSIERMLFGLIYWQEKQESPVIKVLDIRQTLGNIIGDERLKKLEQEIALSG